MQPYDVANKEMELESIITDTRLSKKKQIHCMSSTELSDNHWGRINVNQEN